MGIAVRDEGSKVSSNINVTPMVDVMLVLLIIFMVITPMLNNKINVELVQTENAIALPDADKSDAVIVAVTRDGDIFLGASKVDLDSVGAKVSDMLTDRASKKIYLRADARAKYGIVKNAVDAVRAAGVDQIGLITENVDQGAPNSQQPTQ
jgi:biopolymer transport protein ExbD/biopolymer transport protein TolR